MTDLFRKFESGELGSRTANMGRLPAGWYSPEGDCAFVYAEDVEHRAERVDDLLTVYRALTDDQRIVGVKIKGIKSFPPHDLMHVRIVQERQVATVELLLATYYRQQIRTAELTETYDEVSRRMAGSRVQFNELEPV